MNSRALVTLSVLLAACAPDGESSEASASSEADDGWHITAYETAALDPASDNAAASATEPADLVRAYYQAIDAGDLQRAYEMWEQNGAASGQSFAEFSGGYAETESVAVQLETPGTVEGAAGSQYVDIPVIVTATTSSSEEQRFEGSYTLRRSMVPGAADADWHIYSADLNEAG